MKKQDNNKYGKAAKIKIRQSALEYLGASNAAVLDAFCGERGEMHAAVWHAASYYAGIDIRWLSTDKRRRYVGDNKTFIKHIDLQRYNVFDIDAYGSPWEILEIVARRRLWSAGERGALTFTDCDMRPNKTHSVMGLRHGKNLCQHTFDLHRSALDNWISKSRVRVDKLWQAQIKGTRPRWYCGLVFTGLGRQQVTL